MTDSPLDTRSGARLRNDWWELLASMRFAIALLTIICVASVIGTVLKQGEPLVNYVNAFGPFWAQVFTSLGLLNIYSAGWFLLILFFLVVSTSLCVARNAPKFLADVRAFKEHVRVSALKAFHHKAHGETTWSADQALQRVTQVLLSQGWQLKTQTRDTSSAPDGQVGVMVAAVKGRANKLGYIAAHLAIVCICVGGLLDGELMSAIQARWMGLTPYQGGQDVTPHSLSVRNPAFRAQLFVPEGERSSSAVLNLDMGSLLQPLPFEVELRKFVVEYYDTGMPKRFASEVVIHDPRHHLQRSATVEVNKPVVYDGYTIFQSSFEDGGSKVELQPLLLWGDARAVSALSAEQKAPVQLTVSQDGVPVPPALVRGQTLKLELTGLRPINVEDRGQLQAQGPTGLSAWTEHLGSGDRGRNKRHLTNVGPQITYKLRDQNGQATEFQNYMLPTEIDGVRVFLLGVREATDESFRYLRIPADENMQMTGWLRLKHALADAGLRAQAAQQLAAERSPVQQPELRAQLEASIQRVLGLFAGDMGSRQLKAPDGQPLPPGGFDALTAFITEAIPAAEQARMSEALLRLLNSSLYELNNLARARDGLPPLDPADPATAAFMTPAVVALSDIRYYPAPLVYMPQGFEQRQASVFQVTRTPGRVVVYAGCGLLMLGVFAMLYIRERRVWVWLAQPGAMTQWQMALSSTRQTLDTDHEFDQLHQQLRQTLAPDTDTTP